MTAQTLQYPSLVNVIWDKPSWTRNFILLASGVVLLTVSAKLKIPFYPVPMTMQTFAVLVIGMAYGYRLAGATLLLYLAEGAVGLPVFASGGGIAYFAGPTTGYLVGFLVAAVFVGWLGEKGWDHSVALTFIAMLGGTAIIFVFGVAWLSVFLNDVQAAFANGFTPFIVGAFVKIALAAAVLPIVWRLTIRKRGV